MTFQEGGNFDAGRVRRRGPGKGGVAVGGGIGGIAVVALILILQATGNNDLANVVNQVAGGAAGGGQQAESTLAPCTVAQANTDRECRLEGAIESLDVYWAAAVPSAFRQPGVVSVLESTPTGCGTASNATGPFYCPPDQTIYLDVSFYDELESQLGAEDGPLAEMYVTAHEYGHHIQALTGVMDQADRQGTGAESDSVRTELQADCYAGMWVGDATETLDPDTGKPFLNPITQEQLQNALSAASAVGDDHIQQRGGGDVNPDAFTHGTSEQRQHWFTTGYEHGTLEACDTFAADTL
ncbi:neutral zinc metallopeptidase [Cellulomonas sp. URHE0023]|uniref:KPN_02809 family neutral zinc metallopeptidase n=1 Tax=Cellulomonas sp. URHE0023 TaxID=1380354 RepID=UPI000489BDEC|nr:neutral zinc metallopeptidase [Cellulomonas sp. URHE0023]